MSSAADDPHSNRVNADLPEGSAAAPPDEVPQAAPDNAAETGVPGETARGEEPHRRRRHRRRRPPREFGAPSLAAASVAPQQQLARDDYQASPGAGVESAERRDDGGSQIGGDPASGDRASGDQLGDEPAAGTSAAPAPREGVPGDRPHRRRRRRRRPPPGAQGSAPLGLGSALSPSDAVPEEFGGEGPAAERTAEGTAGGETGPRGRTLHLRRPVRGRRQLPRPPGMQRGLAEAAPPAPGDPSAGEAPAGGFAGAPRAAGDFPPRRRHRRPPPRAAAAAGEGEAARSAPGEADRPRSRGRGPRPGSHPPTDAAPRGDRAGATERRGPQPSPRAGEAEAGGPARRERTDRGRGPGGPRDGQRGRRRDSAPRHVEQKLYTLEIDGRSRI